MDVMEKLKILGDAAKYDAACTSSGASKKAGRGGIGSSIAAGICHSFAGDGRCISLLKVLLTNACIYDCKYCVNRRSSDSVRTAFSPRELADLTMQFYRRNYIEGLFLSSGVFKNPDYTCERMIETLQILRQEYHFAGYIHAKAIPGADSALLEKLGLLADRMSINIEMPTNESLQLLAPDKSKQSILEPMGFIKGRIAENSHDIIKYKKPPAFVPAGQSTQMIVGATKESDRQILNLTAGLYKKYELKRVFFSAYIPAVEHSLLPARDIEPPLWREHRLYQADWLLRFYGFDAKEILDEAQPNFHPYVDPKCYWALRHMDNFPVEVNRVPYEELLRVPGIGVKSAQQIVRARRSCSLDFEALARLGVVLKRAQYFLVCRGRKRSGLELTRPALLRALMSKREVSKYELDQALGENQQLSLFRSAPRLTAAQEEELRCLPMPM